MTNYGVILAAGRGTRMKTELPKCAYPILKKPMLEYTVEAVKDSFVDQTILVVGYKKDIFINMFDNEVIYATQEEQMGTGHAVMCSFDKLEDEEGSTLIICGDLPLITGEAINTVYQYHLDMNDDVTIVTTEKENPKGYGRIVRNENDIVIDIIEEQDTDSVSKLIREVNTGVLIVKTKVLKELFKDFDINTKDEIRMTSIIKLAKQKNYRLNDYKAHNQDRFTGVNDLYALSVVSSKIKMEINKKHMLNGVAIVDPETVTIGCDVQIEPGATILPNTFITGRSYIGTQSEIGPNTEIYESVIGSNTKVMHSLITDSTIKDNVTVGPFAHFRNHTVIGNNMRIGNFVEIKNSQIDDGTKVAHLTYIGDTTCGKNVNFGCGTVTTNYDGKYKHRTKIGNNVFIGCNTNLIAPVKVGNNVFIVPEFSSLSL